MTATIREDVSCPWCGVLFGAHDRICRERQMREIRLLHALVGEFDAREPDGGRIADLRIEIKNCRPFK